MHPLLGPRLKKRRAINEIEALRRTENAFRQDSDYKVIRAEFNPKTRNDVYRIHIGSPPPDPSWGVWIGEIVHNLRSALDGVVYQLALLEPKTPARNTQFPIFLVGTTKKRIPCFEGMKLGNGRSMIRNLKHCHQTQIERLQPYKRGRGGRQCPLWWLHEVNNADKHRLIQVVGSKTGMGPFAAAWGDGFKHPFTISPGKILKHGAKFGEAPRSVGVAPKLIPLIAFWYGCPEVKGKAVVNTLRIITEDVSQIIEDFA